MLAEGMYAGESEPIRKYAGTAPELGLRMQDPQTLASFLVLHEEQRPLAPRRASSTQTAHSFYIPIWV